ncbi:MAG TPA: hypothetical protein VNU49_08400 [Opitutaceae bacterium]|jgi:hypothetical protein|nr:hypothetical protein [Opitutaceae bacterium]
MSQSIFTRDLFSTRAGRFTRRFIFPLLLIAFGALKICRRFSWIGGYEYHGFDAVCIGIGYIGAGLLCSAYYTFSPHNPAEEKIRRLALWIALFVFAAGFSIPIFRNIH